MLIVRMRFRKVFIAAIDYKNILTMKISRFTVPCTSTKLIAMQLCTCNVYKPVSPHHFDMRDCRNIFNVFTIYHPDIHVGIIFQIKLIEEN